MRSELITLQSEPKAGHPATKGSAAGERDAGFFSPDDPVARWAVRRNLSLEKVSLAALALIVAMGLLLRLYCLGAKNLWLDEMWSLVIARLPVSSILWSARNQDPNAGLYNLLLHFWIRMGQSEAVIRALSLVCGVAVIPVLYLLGKRLFHRSVGLLAALLIAINLFHIQYSQEARAYSLVVMLVSLSSLFFVRYLEERTASDWILYVLASALAVYAHIFAILVLASQATALLLMRRREVPWKGLIAAFAATGAGTLPLAILLYERTRAPFVAFNWIPRPTVRRVFDVFYSLVGNAAYYGIEIRHSIAGRTLLLFYVVVCLGSVVFAVRAYMSPNRSREAWPVGFLLVWLFLPIAIVLGFSILFQPWFINRYLLVSLPALVLLAASGIHLLRPKWLGISAFVIILVAEFAGFPEFYRYRLAYQEWKPATDYLVAHQHPGDVAVFCVAHGRLLFEYYRDKDHPGQESGLDLVYPDLKNETTDPRALSYFPPMNTDLIDSIIEKHRRVWLVLYPEDGHQM